MLALMGAPGAFPVHSQNRWLQKFVQWSTKVENTAKEFISTVLNNEPFVGIHLRNGIDFVSETRQKRSSLKIRLLYAIYRPFRGILSVFYCINVII